jgi:hypothetical protein
MKIMYRSCTGDWHCHGTTSSAAIKFVSRTMNKCVFPQLSEPIHVEEGAKGKWLAEGRNPDVLLAAENSVHLMFCFCRHYDTFKN